MQPLVSIVMPAYNAEACIGDAIKSVLAQEHGNWELIVVNDGSTDGTADVVARFRDPRIRFFSLPANKGIGFARNKGLDEAVGELLCTFDSDDVMPPRSLSSRIAALGAHPEADIVDGRVRFMDRDLQRTLREFRPTFEGEPLDELLGLTGSCFMGCSWLIRWPKGLSLRFNTSLSHAEDLLFYIGYARGRRYIAVDEEVLHYRITGQSTMADIPGLERSYRYIGEWLVAHTETATPLQARRFNRRWRRIMFRTWMKRGAPWAALRARFA